MEKRIEDVNKRLAEEVAIVHLYKIIRLLILLMCTMVIGFFVWLSLPETNEETAVYDLTADTQGTESPISQEIRR